MDRIALSAPRSKRALLGTLFGVLGTAGTCLALCTSWPREVALAFFLLAGVAGALLLQNVAAAWRAQRRVERLLALVRAALEEIRPLCAGFGSDTPKDALRKARARLASTWVALQGVLAGEEWAAPVPSWNASAEGVEHRACVDSERGALAERLESVLASGRAHHEAIAAGLL